MDYKIGKVKPNYVSTFPCRGLTFHIHRPIDDNFKKLTEGWQVSYSGVPIQLMNVGTKSAAMSAFKRESKRLVSDDATWVEKVAEHVKDQAATLGL